MTTQSANSAGCINGMHILIYTEIYNISSTDLMHLYKDGSARGDKGATPMEQCSRDE